MNRKKYYVKNPNRKKTTCTLKHERRNSEKPSNERPFFNFFKWEERSQYSEPVKAA